MNKSKHEISTLNRTIYEYHEKMERAENDQIENFVMIRQWYQRKYAHMYINHLKLKLKFIV